MTDLHDTAPPTPTPTPTPTPAPTPSPRRSRRTALIGAGLLALGVAGGAVAVQTTGHGVEMAPARPVAIATLKDDGGIVTVRGRVAEVYGPMFVLADGSGRALVDIGPRNTGAVAGGSMVRVQGRFHDGIVRASFLIGADGKVTALHPFGPPHGPGGPEGPHGHRGPDGMDGPARPDDVPPPPPAGTATAQPAPGQAPGLAPAAR